MNILIVHNRYREAGGEDRVVELEGRLLRAHGHNVVDYIADNAVIAGMGRLTLARTTLWNHTACRDVRDLIARNGVDVVHVHNTLPLVSPSVYYAASSRTAVVQTLHNYRLFCPTGRCFRDGAACTDCLDTRAAWPAVRHACYRGNRAASSVVSAMLLTHRLAGTWRRKVDVYIAPTVFARELLIDAGLPADRVVVKPHFVDPDPGEGTGDGGYALYVGRLSEDKGVSTMLAAWSELGRAIPLLIVGDGPLAHEVAAASAQMPDVTWLGSRPSSDVQALMRSARMLVFPSPAYETFGQVLVEAYAAGTPVVAADVSVASELVHDGRTGLRVAPNDPESLAAGVRWMLAHPEMTGAMRQAARALYLQGFTAAANYPALLSVYEMAVASVHERARGARHTRPMHSEEPAA